MAVFNPQMLQATNPITPNIPQAPNISIPSPQISPITPMPLPAPVQQVFVPVPIPYAEKKKPSMKVSPEAVRKAQGIYPVEQKAKTAMIEQSKMPTPTGAWGAPK